MKPSRHYSAIPEGALKEEEEEPLEPEASPSMIAIAVLVLMSASTALSMASGDYTPPKLAKTEIYSLPEETVPKETSEPDVSQPSPTAVTKAQPTPQKITDASELERLRQKLYNAIDQTWTIPLTATSVYVVRVDETGAITNYTPIHSIAQENIQNTPFPELIQSNRTTELENPTANFAEFEVILTDTGALEVQPHDLKLDEDFTLNSPNQT